ncbi:MAG: glycosyltransferase family 2 protein [Candidatus Eisenbacteria bacterium]|uniref:Glycosyltransferase family 2 protein n=1 Tax=Eiseniibacteriota bacterium TaxID=2212470 RepID=A0A538TKV7_UNCEI|nr:MAG: glycosyltransferase family 2 protein [Candidatus Eisenbacteria bacterium]
MPDLSSPQDSEHDRPRAVPPLVVPPLVSVVIASYNMARYLPDAIHSALAQSYSPVEIHVVDDGSTDETERVMETFAGNPQIFYHRQKNGGQSRAKNRGIRESRGPFVAFLDADDMWSPDKLELQIPLFQDAPRVGVVYTDFQCIDAAGTYLPTTRPVYHSGAISGKLLIKNFVTGMTSVVRRECFDAVGAFDEDLPMSVDYDLWLRISTKYEFRVLDRVTYYYRQWPGQMSHNLEGRFSCAVRIMRRFIEGNPGLVDPATVAEAWAHTYVGRGESIRVLDRRPLNALAFYARALRQQPRYLPAWKGVAKLVLPWLANDRRRIEVHTVARTGRPDHENGRASS